MTAEPHPIRPPVLLVEDDPGVLEFLAEVLVEGGYCPVPCLSAEEALATARTRPDLRLVVTDVALPNMTGLDLLRRLQQDGIERRALVLSASGSRDHIREALALKVHDLLAKPLPARRLVESVRAMQADLEARQPEDAPALMDMPLLRQALDGTAEDGLDRLMACAKLRDNETGDHCRRVGIYAGILAEAMGLSGNAVRMIEQAAALHDLGKIGLPDAILYKPGLLAPDEMREVQEHSRIGHSLLAGSEFPVLRQAAKVALGHHERWDGTGYPNRLLGRAIPLEARITAIADVYDALRMPRLYKPSLDHDQAVATLLEGDHRTLPRHFDPDLLAIFARQADRFGQVFECLPEPGSHHPQAACP